MAGAILNPRLNPGGASCVHPGSNALCFLFGTPSTYCLSPSLQILSPMVDHFKTLIPFSTGKDLAAVVNALPSMSCYPTAPKQLVNHKKYFLMVRE